MTDTQGEHGSHVAGIAAANRFVKVDGEYVDAIEAVGMQGNAPDAQLLVMKVFGQGGGAYDSDCVAAIEDAIVLGADTVNLSLGMALPGFASPTAADDPYVELMADLNNTDTVVVYSAGNAGAWATNSANGELYSDGVSFSMGGESGSYTNSFTVASVDNDGMVSPTIAVGGEKFGFADTSSSNYGNPPFTNLDETKDGVGTEYQYLMIDTMNESGGGDEDTAVPAAVEAAGIDTSKYILVTHRGGTSFFVKGNAGANEGFAGVIVANNQPGTISMDLTGYEGTIPVVSITQVDGQAMWDAGDKAEDGSYVTGTLKVNAKFEDIHYNSKHYTMSDFSSWGITGALELKPEISAPGGGIWSVNGMTNDGYELMSGTSMAAPQITGIGALVQQSLEKRGIQVDSMNDRALTMALIMSTANPMKDADGYYYSLLQQGAGLVDANAAVTTPAFLTVNGRDDGKVKVELGDDPDKTGSYTFSFTVHNITGAPLYYAFNADMFTQASDGDYLYGFTDFVSADATFYVDGVELTKTGIDMKYDFNGDGNVDRKDAEMLLKSIVDGKALENGDVDGDENVDTHDVSALLAMGQAYATVPAKGSVTVTAEITGFSLAAGGYVEGFVTATAMSTPEGVIYPNLSLPILGYYGSWTDPSMFEVGTSGEWWDAAQEGTDEVGGRKPYTADFIFDGQGNDGLTNIIIEDGQYIYVDGDPIGNAAGALQYRYTPIRNSGNGMTQITYVDENGDTQLLWRSENNGPEYGVTYYENAGIWLRPTLTGSLYYSLFNVADVDLAAAIKAIPEGETVDEITVSVVRAPEYYANENGEYNWDDLTDGNQDNGELGEGAFLSTTLKLDLEDPEVIGAWYTEALGDDHNKHVFAQVVDNNSIIDIVLWNNDGEDISYEYNPSILLRYGSSLYYNDFVGTTPDVPYTAEFDGNYGFYENGKDSGVYYYYMYRDDDPNWSPLEDDVYRIQVTDQAGNTSVYRLIAMDTAEFATSVDVNEASIKMARGSTVQLTGIANPKNLEDRSVTWTSDDSDVATVDKETGLVTAVGPGETVITATAAASPEDAPVTAEVTVEVFTIPVTATGVLGDVDGYAKMFTWNFDGGNPEYSDADEHDTVYPMATTLYEDDTILTVDQSGYIYKLSGTDASEELEVSEEAVYGEGYIPFDMTWSEKSGFSYTEANWLMPGDDPFDPAFSGFNLTSYASAYGNLYAVAAVDESWSGTTQAGQPISGDYVIYALTDAGYMWKFMIYRTDEGMSASMSIFPLFTTGFDWSYDGYFDTDNGLLPYSNMVIGDDGNFYVSIMRNNTNEVVRLELIEGEGNKFSYGIVPMGSFGDDVWPALFLDVKTNATETPAEGETFRGEAQAVEIGTAEAQSFKPVTDTESTEPEDTDTPAPAPETDPEVKPGMPEEPSVDESVIEEPMLDLTIPVTPIPEEPEEPDADIQPIVPVGSLDSIEVTAPADGSENGIVVDTENHTVTVPVVASATTNGLVTLAYDPATLHLESVTGGAVLMAHAEGEGSVTIGFANRAELNGTTVATANFTYDQEAEGTTAQVTLTVKEDGESSEVSTLEPVEIALTAPAPEQPGPGTGGTGGSTTPSTPGTSGTPSTPSTPTNPGDTEIDDEDTPLAGLVPEMFKDLVPGAWYYDDVAAMIENGWMNGIDSTTFAPNMLLNRAMAATIIFRTQGSPKDMPASAFVDVKSADYFADAVDWAANTGVVKGISDTKFAPTDNVTRAQMVTMLWRLAQNLGYDVRTDGTVIPESFVDRDLVPDYALEAVCWAYREGILAGKPGGFIDPNGGATRAEVSTMMVRFLKLDPHSGDEIA